MQKEQELIDLLSEHKIKLIPSILSEPIAFRNKAKMVVLGVAQKPILGIKYNNQEVSLCNCPLYPKDMQEILIYLEKFIQKAGIPPYQVAKSKGELKFIILTKSFSTDDFMLRFVLKSKKSIPRIEGYLSSLMEKFNKIKVISVNIQPVHMAILEGDEEIYLTHEHAILENFNNIPLFIKPKSFFQTNPKVAQKLYLTAQEWTTSCNAEHIWDLFCGVGCFGLHCKTDTGKLTGIEIEEEAIKCAKLSYSLLGISNCEFRALNSTDFALNSEDKPDLIIVNPPRAGLKDRLCALLYNLAPRTILYSSCNPKTLADDLKRLPIYEIKKIQIFDLFPHTSHFEVLVLLQLK